MFRPSFQQLQEKQWTQQKFLCVGLDSDLTKLPPSAQLFKKGGTIGVEATLLQFNKTIIDATSSVAAAYKANTAFYEPHGTAGVRALEATIAYIQEKAPEVPVILDAKRGDIGNTNLGYGAAAFDLFQADAITVHPYLGEEALRPLLDRREKGIIVLCKTSNPGSGEFQNLVLQEGIPLYLHISRQVATHWNQHGNCSLVVGATYPEELATVRKEVGTLPLLIPGIGAQGGSLEKTVVAAQDHRGFGMLLSVSRAILFASSGEDFAEAAEVAAAEFHHKMKEVALKNNPFLVR